MNNHSWISNVFKCILDSTRAAEPPEPVSFGGAGAVF